MKIESNVQTDNISAVVEEREGRKVFKKSLRLNKETIRELKGSDLRRVAGGASGPVCGGSDWQCYTSVC